MRREESVVVGAGAVRTNTDSDRHPLDLTSVGGRLRGIECGEQECGRQTKVCALRGGRYAPYYVVGGTKVYATWWEAD